MATGLGLRVIVRPTGALLSVPTVDSAAGGNLLESAHYLALPPGQSSASVGVRTTRRKGIPQSWHPKDRLTSSSLAIGNSVAMVGLTFADERTGEDGEESKHEPQIRGEFQEPHLPEDQSRVQSSGESEPISQSEGEVPSLNENQRGAIVKKKLVGIISNAQKQSQGVSHIRPSLGIDLGDSRTGVAISLRGYAPRPLSVLPLKGDKLIANLLQIASKEKADEFIVGLPISFDGKETSQSKKTRSFTGRLATQAAQRGLRVYLLDEYGSSQDGMDYMLDIGIKKKSRKEKLDAYAALV